MYTCVTGVVVVAGGGVPSILQEVQVPIIENQVCQDMFETAGHTKTILSSFLCAGYANGQRDSCEVRTYNFRGVLHRSVAISRRFSDWP